MDTFSKKERSEIMRRVKGKGNRSTEQRLVALLRERQLSGWRRHLPLPGKPDVAYPRQKVAIFVDGCFWHGCPRHCRIPATNRAYWTRKIERNKMRDRCCTRELKQNGWTVIRIWEHEFGAASLTRKLNRLAGLLGRE